MVTKNKDNAKLKYSASAINYPIKKIAGFEVWFYSGPSLHFGHFPSRKSGK